MTSVEIPHAVAAALPTLSVFDITNEVSRDVAGGAPSRGIAYVTAAAPTSLVRVSERESGFFCDVEALVERLVPGVRQDRERLLLALLGPRMEQIPFEARRLCLGQWQRVLLFCFDGDSRADYTLTLVGWNSRCCSPRLRSSQRRGRAGAPRRRSGRAARSSPSLPTAATWRSTRRSGATPIATRLAEKVRPGDQQGAVTLVFGGGSKPGRVAFIASSALPK